MVDVRVIGGDTVLIANENTTIGYATFDKGRGLLTYIFVNPGFRRRGFGSMLVAAAEKSARRSLKPASPISPLGSKFFGVCD